MKKNIKLAPSENYDKKVHHAIRIKKQAVNELETGELTLQQVMDKYQIIDRRSVISWMRQYSKLDESEYIQKPIPVDIRRKAAYQVEAGVLTIKQAAKEYLVTPETIRNWEKQYSCNSTNYANQQEMLTKSPELINRNLPEEKKESHALKMKIAALETMIDVAEKQFNIEIRKKPGTKQLKQ